MEQNKLNDTIDKDVIDSFLKKGVRNLPSYILPSNKWAIEMAAKIPYASVSELIDNAEKIKEYCKQPL